MVLTPTINIEPTKYKYKYLYVAYKYDEEYSQYTCDPVCWMHSRFIVQLKKKTKQNRNWLWRK